VLYVREVEPQHAPGGDREQLLSLGEIRGEEDDEADLRELAGLERERADPDPELRPVYLLTERDRQQEQPHAYETQQVLVAGEHPDVANEDERGDEARDAHDRPCHLRGTESLGRQAIHRGEPQGVEDGRDRQDQRVGVRRDLSHDYVRHDVADDEHRHDRDGDVHARAVPGKRDESHRAGTHDEGQYQ
jgi:hypothetical protein